MSGNLNIEEVKRWKDAILKSSQLIRGHLEKLDNSKNEEAKIHVTYVKQEIETIFRYLSDLRGYADNETKEFIDTLNQSGIIFLGMMDIEFFKDNRSLITRWSGEANTISIEVSKPHWMIGGGIKARLYFLELFLEAHRSH